MKPPTEQELRKLATDRAELGDVNYFAAKTHGAEIFEELSRESYIMSAALERWADEMKEEREHAEWMSGVDRFAKSVFKSIKNKGTK